MEQPSLILGWAYNLLLRRTPVIAVHEQSSSLAAWQLPGARAMEQKSASRHVAPGHASTDCLPAALNSTVHLCILQFGVRSASRL